MSVQVRRADVDDVEAIVAFGSFVVPAHYTPLLGAAAAHGQLSWWSHELITAAVTAERIHLATVDGTVVGMVETGQLEGEQVIWKLYVEPDSRGRSLGVELLHHATATLPVGTGHVLLEHFAGNKRAGAFYEREGFVVVDIQSDDSGDPRAAVVWRRREIKT